MYGRGQIHVPTALLGTSLTGGGVDLTAVLDTLLPCHVSILPTERRAVLHDTGVGIQQPKGTRIVQADPDSDSESRRRSSRRLAAGWDADYRRWLQTSRNNGIDRWRRCSSYCFTKYSLKIEKREKRGSRNQSVNPLNAELNPICHLLELLGVYFLHVSRIRVKSLTLRLLMSYISIWSTYSWCF